MCMKYNLTKGYKMSNLKRLSKTLKSQLYVIYEHINGDIVTFWDCRNPNVYSNTGIYITISRLNSVTGKRYDVSCDRVFKTLPSAKKYIITSLVMKSAR